MEYDEYYQNHDVNQLECCHNASICLRSMLTTTTGVLGDYVYLSKLIFIISFVESHIVLTRTTTIME